MSHNHCHDESCHSGHHHHHHHDACHEHEEHCGCCCHEHEHHHFSDQLLAMADEAWMEVLKDKIKQKIQETTGQHLDQLASLVAASNHQRWNTKMAAGKEKEDYKEKIANFFNH